MTWPIDLLAWIYQKWFLGHPFRGLTVICTILFLIVGVIVSVCWYLAIDRVQSDQQIARQEELEALGTLMDQGTQIYIMSQGNQSVFPAYREWEQRLAKFLEQSLNKGYRSRLATAGTDRPVPAVNNPENQLVIGMTERYRNAIDEFMKEIGQATFSVPIKLESDTRKLLDRSKLDLLLNPPPRLQAP